MKTEIEVLKEVRDIFQKPWTRRDGRKVPESEDLLLKNDAIDIDATVLYADMTDSTGLVDDYKPEFAAEIYKSYLIASCRIIRNMGGEITAFDGDRVMSVFIGTSKNSNAAKAALHINHVIKEINKELVKQYPSTSYKLKHTIGIDTSNLLVAKTGIRNSNDLIWVGKSANYASKLCGLGSVSYPIYITAAVYNKLAVTSKYGGQPKQLMWQKATWAEKGKVVYRSNWTWSF